MRRIVQLLPILLFGLIACTSVKTDNKELYINQVFEIDTVLTLDGIDESESPCFAIENDNLYIYPNKYLVDSKHKQINKIIKYDLKNRKLKEIRLNLPDSLKDLHFKNIEVSNDFFFLIDWDKRLSIYDRHNKHIINSISVPRPYTYIKFVDNKLFLMESGIYSSNRNTKTRTHLGIYNLSDNTLNNYDIKDPENYQFSYFSPTKFVAISKKCFIVSEIDKYKLRLYDYDLNNVNTISYRHKDWVKIDESLYKDIKPSKIKNHTAKYYIDMLRPYYFDMSFIRKINFINDSLLLINWTIPIKNIKKKELYDIWKYNKTNNKFEPLKLKLTDKIPNMDNKFIDTKILPFYNNYIVMDNYLIDIQPIPISIYQDITYQELLEKINDYFVNNNMKYSIIIRKYKGIK